MIQKSTNTNQEKAFDRTMKEEFVMERILELCKERGWTKYRLSKETGIPSSTINNLIKRTNTPTIPTLIKICNAFGFYDGHSHFSTGGLTALYYEDLKSKPIGTMTCIADYIKALKNRASITPEHKPVLGTGYDQTTISEMRHPTRQELDMVSTGRPVILNHVTAHIMAVNSKALEIMGINADTPDPEGGVIRRDKDGIPNGILEESAVFYVWNNKEFS